MSPRHFQRVNEISGECVCLCLSLSSVHCMFVCVFACVFVCVNEPSLASPRHDRVVRTHKYTKRHHISGIEVDTLCICIQSYTVAGSLSVLLYECKIVVECGKALQEDKSGIEREGKRKLCRCHMAKCFEHFP